MKWLFSILWLATQLHAAEESVQVSLRNVPLRASERIAWIEVAAAGGRFSDLRIPADWTFQVGAPESGVATLRGGAVHGVGMPFTVDAFQRFVRVVFSEKMKRSVSVRLGLYLYDSKQGESERAIELGPDSVALEAAKPPSAAKE